MEGFDLIRHGARLRHTEARAKREGVSTGAALLDGATEITGIARQAVPDDDPVLCGAEAVLEKATPAIFYKKSVSPAEAVFCQAHEFAHYWLDNGTGGCGTGDIDESMPEERIPLGIQRVEGYGARERRECQANVFAREFLLPSSEARRLFLEGGLSAGVIAERLGVPLGMVHQQLALALLVPDSEIGDERGERTLPPLDDSQRDAAEAEEGPHLIEAGPGTGKTRTLTARIEWLLKRGVEPSSLLALTFSNKAAEEMRERVALAAPQAAPAMRLEAHGIPVLYLGDLFERPEVRDMLALMSLTCEPERGGLFRLAQFPEYRIPVDDARKVLNFADANGIYPMEAMQRLHEIPDLTTEGRTGLDRLAGHLRDVDRGTTPGTLLFDYLFTKSRYLESMLADSSIAGQQGRLALYQFLQFALEHKPAGRGNWRNQLLQWIRRLETFGEERQLRELPAAAKGLDAVRLLTVHASKGLEFSTVYLPGLGTGMFPVSPGYNPCPPPKGMLAEDPKDSHAEEEECLFFVAMSRAQDVLCLSRADMYGAVKRSASPLLVKIASHLPRSPEASGQWRGGGLDEPDEGPLAHLGVTLEEHAAEDLDQYIKCPRAYFYQRVLRLSGARDDNAYVRFHRAVYAVLRWMGSIEASKAVGLNEAMERLRSAWEQIGPVDHPYSPVYLHEAEVIVERAIARRVGKVEIVDADWCIDRPGGRIRVRPDHVEIGTRGPVVRRLRTGRPPKKIDDDIYALYHEGARQPYGKARVEALYLTTDEVVPVDMSAKVIANRLEKYDAAMAGIGAGEFPAKQNDRICPRCPQYFICPALPGADCPAARS